MEIASKFLGPVEKRLLFNTAVIEIIGSRIV